MKKITTLQIISILFISGYSFAQNVYNERNENEIYSDKHTNDALHPCISESEYKALETEIEKKKKYWAWIRLIIKLQ